MTSRQWEYATSMSSDERDAFLLGLTYNDVHMRLSSTRKWYNVFGSGDPRQSRYWKTFIKSARKLRERGWDFYSYLMTVYPRYQAYFGKRLYPSAIVSSWGIKEYAKELTKVPYAVQQLRYREILRYYLKKVSDLITQWDISTLQAVQYLVEQGMINHQVGRDLLAITGVKTTRGSHGRNA